MNNPKPNVVILPNVADKVAPMANEMGVNLTAFVNMLLVELAYNPEFREAVLKNLNSVNK